MSGHCVLNEDINNIDVINSFNFNLPLQLSEDINRRKERIREG